MPPDRDARHVAAVRDPPHVDRHPFAVDDDPLFATLFAANLGSVDMEAGYHHLWEYGTCSIFAMMGRVKTRIDGSRFFEIKFSYDERMADGLYGGISMEMIKTALENPERLV